MSWSPPRPNWRPDSRSSATSSANGFEAEIVPIGRASRRWVGPLLGAAAALLVVAGLAIGSRLLDTETPSDHVVAMVGTDLAPAAQATASIDTSSLGTRIILDVTDLPPAPDGQYYQAWLRQSPEIGVSAGTFHLRGGDGAIERWAGVTAEDHPLITVTLQDEGRGRRRPGRSSSGGPSSRGGGS